MGKTWLEFSSRTWSLGEGNTKQEEIGGGEKEGKEMSLGVQIRNARQRRCLTQSQREVKFDLAMPSLQEVPVTSIQTIPTKVDDAIIDIQEFCSPQQKCRRRWY